MDSPPRSTVAQAPATSGTFLQVGAYGQRGNAEELAHRLKNSDLDQVSIHESDDLFRVWLGPFADSMDVERIIQRVIDLGFEPPT